MVGKEKVVMSLEIKEGENLRKEFGMNFQKEGMVRTRCYRRPSEIRTEQSSFSLAITRPLGIEAQVMRQRWKPNCTEARKKKRKVTKERQKK